MIIFLINLLGFGVWLLGWAEELPLEQDIFDEKRLSRPENPHSDCHGTSTHPGTMADMQVAPKALAAGKRAKVATHKAGLTAGLKNKQSRVTSHLFSFGEYCAAYLLAHSPACWPAQLPTGREATRGRKTIRQWDNDRRNMEQFLYSLWKVRRLLANVAVYTIFDDHDVSDDWNLNKEWCLRILGKSLGYRTVQNALLAYALFQAWGNTPAQFESNEPGSALLKLVPKWSASGGQDEAAHTEIASYLGLPPVDARTGLPEFVRDGDVWVLKRASLSLTWHYTVRSACHEVIVLDTRTQRGYSMNEEAIAPPMLLSPTAFKGQIDEPLANSHLDRGQIDRVEQATFVVAPTNVFGMRVLDVIQQWHLARRKVFTADVGDSWNFHDQALATLLLTLFEHRNNIVVLSGDIHYSSALQVDYENLITGDRAKLTQFTASAIKNEESLTQLLHTRLKDWLLPEKTRRWVGWHAPADMEEIKVMGSGRRRSRQQSNYDWRIEMRWQKRQQSKAINTDIADLVPPRARAKSTLLAWLKFWKARWIQEGHEVVGVNNIALIHFRSERLVLDPSASVTSEQINITQDHYWFTPWLPTQIVRSRFK